jgi:hypothetical protein
VSNILIGAGVWADGAEFGSNGGSWSTQARPKMSGGEGVSAVCISNCHDSPGSCLNGGGTERRSEISRGVHHLFGGRRGCQGSSMGTHRGRGPGWVRALHVCFVVSDVNYWRCVSKRIINRGSMGPSVKGRIVCRPQGNLLGCMGGWGSAPATSVNGRFNGGELGLVFRCEGIKPRLRVDKNLIKTRLCG